MRPSYPLALCCLALFAWPAHSAEGDPIAYFEKHVRPIFVEKCQSCHGPKKQQGSLRVDSRKALLEGGDTGPALVVGKPDESLLVKAIRRQGKLKMPSREADKLLPAEVEAIATWVKMGAPWPAEKAVVVSTIAEVRKSHWAFRPVVKATPPATRDAAWAVTPVDRFILAKLEAKGLTPSPQADRVTIIRRLSFDLLGLPPSPEEVEAFVADARPDAYERLVETMLASPAYGERWGRHWLDVARYADTKGYVFTEERRYPFAFTYRDYVIDALNADLPYDEFILHQLAADRLFPGPDRRPLAAMGFLTLGRRFLNNTHDIIDDRIDVVTRGLMGLTVSCARCHDHKFDPIPTRDYYSLAGIYMGTNMSDAPLAPAAEVKVFTEAQGKLKQSEDTLKKAQTDLKDRKGGFLGVAVQTFAVRVGTEEVAKLKKEMPPAPPVAHVVSGNGPGMKVYIRGNPATTGENAPKGFLQVLPSPAAAGSNFTRLDLANAIASKDNPLTARVIVNRAWAWHFGRGLVNTPSNFGALGDRPSHPELLDWLAVNFMRNGWSMKWLHKQIMTTATYQLESKPDLDNDKSDAANVYLWRGTRKRLDIEDWRDTLLAVSGNLDPKSGGPTFDLRDANAKRRTVYAKVSRHELDGLLRLFDFPDANVTADKRTVTTVPQQQLFALNSDFMVSQAKALAVRVEKVAGLDAERVTAAYRIAYGRAPEKSETDLAVRFLALPTKPDDKLTRWQQYAQVLLASNELMYVD